jgi:hypothetical protein
MRIVMLIAAAAVGVGSIQLRYIDAFQWGA